MQQGSLSKALPRNPGYSSAISGLPRLIQFQTQTARLTDFVQWLDQLDRKKFIADNRTRQALDKIRQQATTYSSLSTTEQAQLNLAVITLNQFRAKVGKFKNGDFYKISYPFDEEESFPKPDKFHLQLKRNGLNWESSKVKKAREIPVETVYLAPSIADPNFLFGFIFPQTFKPIAKTRQEFETLLEAIIPPGYIVRMTPHELGLSNNRRKFRKGMLHLHLEKTNIKPGQIPLDVSLNIGLSLRPYVGIIDPISHKILVPFKDKKIARAYLGIFEKYLSPEAKFILEKIAY